MTIFADNRTESVHDRNICLNSSMIAINGERGSLTLSGIIPAINSLGLKRKLEANGMTHKHRASGIVTMS